MAFRSEIMEWLLDAKAKGATHMIRVLDRRTLKDHPVLVMPGQGSREVWNAIHEGCLECYDLSLDLEKQLNESMAQHFGPARVEEMRQEISARIDRMDKAMSDLERWSS